jgi:hypothetical protein
MLAVAVVPGAIFIANGSKTNPFSDTVYTIKVLAVSDGWVKYTHNDGYATPLSRSISDFVDLYTPYD